MYIAAMTAWTPSETKACYGTGIPQQDYKPRRPDKIRSSNNSPPHPVTSPSSLFSLLWRGLFPRHAFAGCMWAKVALTCLQGGSETVHLAFEEFTYGFPYINQPSRSLFKPSMVRAT